MASKELINWSTWLRIQDISIDKVLFCQKVNIKNGIRLSAFSADQPFRILSSCSHPVNIMYWVLAKVSQTDQRTPTLSVDELSWLFLFSRWEGNALAPSHQMEWHISLTFMQLLNYRRNGENWHWCNFWIIDGREKCLIFFKSIYCIIVAKPEDLDDFCWFVMTKCDFRMLNNLNLTTPSQENHF